MLILLVPSENNSSFAMCINFLISSSPDEGLPVVQQMQYDDLLKQLVYSYQ